MNEIMSVTATGLTEFSKVSGTAPVRNSSFDSMVMSGIAGVEKQSDIAMNTLANYAVGNEVSPHELMISIEQARMSVQLTVEIRNRLVEAYQELSRMQI